MALASSSSVAVRYVKEATFGVVNPAVQPTFMRITGETLKFAISKESSKEINAGRTIASVVPVTASASGGVNTEISYGTNDDFLASVMQSGWNVYGAAGEGTTLSLTFTATTIVPSVATTGTNLFTLLQPGQWFRINGAGPNAGKILRVHPTTVPTPSLITLDTSTPAAVSAAEACTLQSSRLTHSNIQSSFTIERQNSDIGVFIAYTGLTPSKFSTTIASGALSTMNFEFMGKGGLEGNVSAFTGATLDSTSTEIHSGVAGATLAVWMDGAPIAGTYVKSVTIDFDNALRSQEAIGTLGAVGIGSGTINCTLSLSVYFANKDLFTKFRQNTNSSFIFSSTDTSGNGYIFTIPKANITDWTSNASAKDQDQMLDINVTALEDRSNVVPGLRKLLFIDRIGSGITSAVLDTRPRFFLAPATAYNTGTQAFIDGATVLAGSSNNAVGGSFTITTTAGNYGWLAVPASAAPAGIHINNTTDGNGGWSGAGNAGNNTGASPDPTTVNSTFTDSLGRNWKLFRMDYVNSAPTAKLFTVTTV